MVGRRRLDAEVVERGLADTRARAQAMILGGGVTVEGEIISKPSHPVEAGARIALVREPMPYVSRGGLKLRHALDVFDLDVTGRVAVDVGASTGGFTDVLLQAGAMRVYAIDVGYGQLAWTLRNDPRVIVMERTNIRNLELLPEPASIAAVDVSFISLRTVLPPIEKLLEARTDVVALIKPQFEAGKDRVGKKGVVRDPAVWRDVIESVLTFAESRDWHVRGLVRSPITGLAGNVEFLMHLSREGQETDADVQSLIEAALTPPPEEEPKSRVN
jgi:23S rRNA (cytidine1920-2'-O)/16S rRNA (cytidine1409-2'-O)-methyltransferase